MGQLVFIRLLYHHYFGNLEGLSEFKSRLKTYLEGIEDHKTLYTAYPNVLLAINLISTIGHLIVKDVSNDNEVCFFNYNMFSELETVIFN